MQKGTATEPKVSNYSVSVSVSCAIPKEQFNIMYHLPGLGMDALIRGIDSGVVIIMWILKHF